MNIFELATETADHEKSFRLAVRLGLIKLTPPRCPKCGFLLTLESGKTRHGINGRWRCGKKVCRHTQSVYKDTIFDGIHTSISCLLRIIYCWSVGFSLTQTCNHIGLTKKSVLNWFKIFRRILTLEYMSSNTRKIGGVGMTVEVDETHLCKRKYNVGRILLSEAVWIVGGICRETKEVFLVKTTRRNEATLRQILLDNIHPGTNVITDCWKGYLNIDKDGFYHATVNHRYHFVNPENVRIHTQNIERVWRSLKSSIPKSVPNGHKNSYLIQFLYERKTVGNNRLERFNRFTDLIVGIFGRRD